MQRALDLAAKAQGRTHPNPMVGCVIVHKNRCIGEGWHKQAGKPHAEIEALRQAGSKAQGARAYITLEPCAHQGRTGPCVEALIQAQVAHVVVGMRDPNPKVLGRGLKRLRQAGIGVTLGVQRQACQKLNAAFICSMLHKRPWVVAKMAQSLDGCIATRTGQSQWITSPAARKEGHKLRAHMDAISVGINTILADDPRLTCRLRGGSHPKPIVWDSLARTPIDAQIMHHPNHKPILMVGPQAPKKRLKALHQAGAKIIELEHHPNQGLNITQGLQALHSLGVMGLLLEGGPSLLGSFFDAGLVDRVVAFIAPKIIGGSNAKSSVAGLGPALLGDATMLKNMTIHEIGSDWMLEGDVAPKPPNPTKS